jgi:hypothetical protein
MAGSWTAIFEEGTSTLWGGIIGALSYLLLLSLSNRIQLQSAAVSCIHSTLQPTHITTLENHPLCFTLNILNARCQLIMTLLYQLYLFAELTKQNQHNCFSYSLNLYLLLHVLTDISSHHQICVASRKEETTCIMLECDTILTNLSAMTCITVKIYIVSNTVYIMLQNSITNRQFKTRRNFNKQTQTHTHTRLHAYIHT